MVALWAALGLASTVPGQSTQPAGAGHEPISGRRIVKHFDFDERPWGNIGTVPSSWRPHRAVGFPIFLEGRFEEQVGHAAGPSFRLDLDGGSVAYTYEGNDIAVRSDSDYLIVAWLRTAGLDTARAYVTTYFLDRKGNPLPGTERRSPLVGGRVDAIDWQAITVAMHGDVQDARYIGLTLWLTQQSVWDNRPRLLRAIERENVKGTAWFDDVTVYRLPRVALRSSSPGNVFAHRTPVQLWPDVTDPDGLKLTARLVVRSADGEVVDDRAVAVREADMPLQPCAYPDLPVGLYEATLTVSTEGVALVERTLRFVRLSERAGPPQTMGRGFGVVLSQVSGEALAGDEVLLKPLRAEWVKLPVWNVQEAVSGVLPDTDVLDGYLRAVVEAGGSPVAVQQSVPTGAKPVPGVPSLLELLSEDPLAWKPLVAGQWARYAGLVHVWQIGQDGDEGMYLDHRLPDVLPALHREMSELVSNPVVASPVSARYAPGAGPCGEYASVLVRWSTVPADIARQVGPLVTANPQRTWLTVEPLPADRYPRLLRLVDFSRRLAEAYYANPEAVFLPAPWDSEPTFLHVELSPREEYILFHTFCDLLGGARPIARMNLGGEAQAMVFDRGGVATLFVWDDYAPPEGREQWLSLGEYAEEIDLWGRRSPIRTEAGRQCVRVGPVPSFLISTSTWLIEFQRQVRLEPPLLEASAAVGSHEVVFRNTYREPISGMLRLIGPEHWDFRPSRMAFALQPGQEFRQAVEVRFPLNADAGMRSVVGEFTLDADRRYLLLVPAWFDLGLDSIDLEAYVYRRGDKGIVRVAMTNRTTEPVYFDGDVLIPGRQRLSRLFQNILPGQSVTKEYVLDRIDELSGRYIRVHFSERQGSRMWNRVLLVP